MKKQTFSFLLVLCMLFGMLPVVLASESGNTAGSPNFNVGTPERTATGLRCQVNLTGRQEGDTLWAVVFAEFNGAAGQMKQCNVADTAANPVTVELRNVLDTDFVRLVWMDRNCTVRGSQAIARPPENTNAESGIQEAAGEEDFDTQVLNLLHPEFLSASSEMAMEEAAENDPYAYKRLIVSSDRRLPSLSAYGNPYVIYNPTTGHSVLQFSTASDARTCAAYLSELSYVRYAEPDILLRGGPMSSEDYLNAASTEYLSWGVQAMKADVLSAALQTKSGTSPVVVAVADSGVQMNHPLFQGRLTDTGYDFIDNDNDPEDAHSHGTHVAGTIVDCTRGLLDIQIMPVRVLSATGGGTAAGIALGIRHAVRNGAKVINLSLGGGHSNYLDDAIREALEAGVTVVVAAGNEGNSVMEHCPAHIADVITVGAVDSDRQRASFSNYGESVDLAAPGVGIRSSILNSEYGLKNGTSMASPHVAAAAAMLKYGFPDKTPAEIQQALKDTATDLGASGWDRDYGYGFPNLEAFASEWPTPNSNPNPNPNPDPAPVEHTYELFDTGLVWEEARAYCANLGGHLMTVTSAEEQATLEELLQDGGKNSYWLGANLDDDGNFRWVTNEEFSYTNWANNQPDTHHGTENSLMVYRNENPFATSSLGKWNDLDADGTCLEEEFFGLDNFGFVCEWDGPRPAPATPGVYAILYADGELVFQNNNRARQSKEVLEVYPVDGNIPANEDSASLADGDEDISADYADWYAHRAQITRVTILDRIQPTSTALWFHGCENLESVSGLEYLDTSRVTNMSHMFSECYELTDLNLSSFDTSNVTNMSHMFYDCENLVNLDLTSFNTANVTDMGNMFAGCTALNRVYATEAFAVTAVTNSLRMFYNCTAIEGTYGTRYDREHIDKEYARLDDNNIPPVAPGYFTDNRIDPGVANVYLYSDGELVFQRLDQPDSSRTVVEHYTINVVDRQNYTWVQALWYEHREEVNTVTFADLIRPFAVSQWFYGFRNLTTIRNIENLDTRAVTDMSLMFSGCSALTTLDVSHFDTSRVTNMSSMFKDCSALTSLDIGNFDTTNVTDMSAMFQGCSALPTLALNNLHTEQVTNMSNMFRDCSALTSLDLASFNTASLTDMNYMFRNCRALTALDVSNFNTAQVVDMKYLFSGCESLTALDLRAFDTASVTDMQSMFSGCASLTTLNVTSFNTANVTNMNSMFRGLRNLTSLDISAFNTGSVTDMSGMFAETGLTALDLHTFDTANVTNMSGMFQSSDALTVIDLTEEENSRWSTARVTDMSGMFRDCSALTTVNVKLDTFPTDAATESADMFTGSTNIVGGRGTAYDAAHIDKEYGRIDFGQRAPGYFTDPNMVVLTFDPNGDEEDPVSGTMEEQLFSKGVEDTLSANQFTREGYDFTGWNTRADGSGTSYADGATITLLSDMTLYAQWDYAAMENLYAILYSDGELVFQWNDTPAEGRTVVRRYVTDRQGYSDNRATENNYRAWHDEAGQIRTVTFAKRIQPDDIAQWFEDCVNLTEIRNLDKLNTSLVVDMSRTFANCVSLTALDLSTFDTANVGTNLQGNFNAMFENCSSLTTVDLSSFDTANASAMKDMFSGCEALTTIYASDRFVTAQVTGQRAGQNVFMDCFNLVGGNGTRFNPDNVNVGYAHIDTESNPGYFTERNT